KSAAAAKKTAPKPKAKAAGRGPQKAVKARPPAPTPAATAPSKAAASPTGRRPMGASKPGTAAKHGHLARPPKGAEELKARLGALSAKVAQIRALRRSIPKNFYDIGVLLGEIETDRLFEVKGYGSFEAFV